MVLEDVDELSAGEALVAFGDLRRTRDRASRDIFVLAAHFADLYHLDSADPGGLHTLPGTERAIKVAGDGAPLVAEFAIAEMAAELAMTTWSARRLIGDALETRHRLPRVWARLLTGEVAAWMASKIAQATRDLTAEQAATVDAGVAEYADGRLPWTRFAELLEAKVIEADPDAAAEREQAAARERFAKVGQSNEHGQKTLYVKTSAAEMARIDATIAYVANALRAFGDPDNEDLRRTKAILLMANPTQAVALLQALRTATRQDGADSGQSERRAPTGWADEDSPLPDEPEKQGDPEHQPNNQDEGAGTGADRAEGGDSGSEAAPAGAEAFLEPFRPGDVPACTCRGGSFTYDTRRLLPEVTLYLHLHADTLARGNGVARWEGEGPISAQYVREFLGPHARFVVKPVIDPATMPPVDGYETPERLREALHLRTPADVFPYAPNTGRTKQADHSTSYRPPEDGGPPGQTSLDNLGGMTAYHHRVKTHAGWSLKQPFPGIYVWQSPHGSVFLVDHTGTRQIRRPRAAATGARQQEGPSSATRRAGPSVLELCFKTLVDKAAA